MRKVILILLALSCLTWANTPGRHTVLLTWTAAVGCSAPTCTYNVYRGSTANVCAANNNNPIPYATGITSPTYIDQTPLTGGDFYNVSTVDPSRGGESTCDGEVQVTVQTITTPAPSGLAGTPQ